MSEQAEELGNYGGARSGAGRPIEITEEKLKRLAVCRIMNLNKERTAKFMGIAKTTFYEWEEKAKRVQDLADSGDWDLLTMKDKLYLKFSYVYDNATTELMAGCVADLREAGKKHWQALSWLLERLDPEQWARFEPQPVARKRGERLLNEDDSGPDGLDNADRIDLLQYVYENEILSAHDERDQTNGIAEASSEDLGAGNGKPPDADDIL